MGRLLRPLVLITGLLFSYQTALAQGQAFILPQASSALFSPIIISEINDRAKGLVEPDSWSNYLSDSCLVSYSHISNEDALRGMGLRRCNDGTVSFEQPDSEGVLGNEGKCGQTAASNALMMYCGLVGDPQKYSDYFMNDITPGVRVGTLEDGLNNIFENEKGNCPAGTWVAKDSDNYHDYLRDIELGLYPTSSHKNFVTRTRSDGRKVRRAPVLALLRSPGGAIPHWVSITDITDRRTDKCMITVNHWDDQYTVPCHIFGKWSWGIQDSWSPLLDAYTILVFE